MADVSLDDLIKQDKSKGKVNRTSFKKPFHKTYGNKPRFHDQHDNRPARQQDDNRPFKQKFIKKEYQGKRFQRRQEEESEEERQPRQEKPKKVFREQKRQQEGEPKEKQVRTLKVMGLNPQFTNEDLYKLFATEGALQKCLIEQDNFGRSLLTAIVKYYNHESATTAIQHLNRHKIMNCVLTVQPYKNVRK